MEERQGDQPEITPKAQMRIRGEHSDMYARSSSLRDWLAATSGQSDPELLLVSPHDDDGIISCAITAQQALSEKIPVSVVVVTNGSQGYCNVKDRPSIVYSRMGEMFDGYGHLGIDKEHIAIFGYPDMQTMAFEGRRPIDRTDRNFKVFGENHTGLGNSFVRHFREVRPTHVFSPHPAEFHPDHRTVSQAVRIAVQHAASEIWSELGESLPAVPELLEYPVGTDFERPPTHAIQGTPEQLERKMAALDEFKSQSGILGVAASVRKSDAFEFFRQQPTSYNPARYLARFGFMQSGGGTDKT